MGQQVRMHPRCTHLGYSQSLAGLGGTVIHFSTPTCVHSCTVVGLRIHPGRPQIPTQVLLGPAPGGRDSSGVARLPWDLPWGEGAL